jgi:dTMP kinase
VCDRYVPSSLVYQGYVREVPLEFIEAVNEGVPAPDVVILLDVPDEVAFARGGDPSDRIEREGDTFHRKVREGYRKIAAERNWVVVDGSRAPDQVAEAVWDSVRDLVDRSS